MYCFNVYQIKLGEERQAESSEREVSDEQEWYALTRHYLNPVVSPVVSENK